VSIKFVWWGFFLNTQYAIKLNRLTVKKYIKICATIKTYIKIMVKYIPKKKFLLLAGDVFLILFACTIAPAVRFRVFIFEPLDAWLEILVVLFINILCFYIADFYNAEQGFINIRFIFKYLITIAIAFCLTLLVFFLFPRLDADRGVFIINFILIWVFVFLWRYLFEKVIKRFKPAKQKVFLIVGAGRTADKIYGLLRKDASVKVAGFIDYNHAKRIQHKSIKYYENTDEIDEIVKNEHVDHIVLTIRELKDEELIKKILACKLKGIKIYDVPTFYEEMLGKIEVEHLNDIWILNMPIHGVKKTVYNRKIKRLISIFTSIFLLILFSPVTLLTIIAIKLDSKGPIFFKQKRVGLNGNVFEVVKFRTMKVGTENDRTHAGEKDDPRITRVGRILRLARIDEIPQLWNVLKGEMSLIGPRALMIEEVEEFEKKIPYFSVRHAVKPGVTGWAQVNYPHGTTVEDALEKLKYDLFYIKNLSLFLDFYILLRTVRTMLLGRGAR